MIMVIIVVWRLGPIGLGWVMGPQVHLAVGQLFGGLGWVDEMDPWRTLWQPQPVPPCCTKFNAVM